MMRRPRSWWGSTGGKKPLTTAQVGLQVYVFGFWSLANSVNMYYAIREDRGVFAVLWILLTVATVAGLLYNANRLRLMKSKDRLTH